MNQHSRASSIHASRSKPINVDKRVEALEQLLEEVFENSNQLKRLNELHEAMPQINETEKSLKQLQKDIDACFKQIAQIQIYNEKQHLNTQTNSLSRNIKSSSKTLNDLRHSIKQLSNQLPQLKKSRHLTQTKQLSQCKSNIEPLLQKNKRQIQNILKQFQQDCLLLQINGENKHIQSKIKDAIISKKSNWNNQLKKLNIQLGAIKCQAEFIKDKNKKDKVLNKFNDLLLQQGNIGKDKSLILGIAEEEIQLIQLQNMLNNNIPIIVKYIQEVEDHVNILNKVLKKSEFQSQSLGSKQQHFKRQILYFNDRWFNLKNKLHGFKKKYLIKIREIQQRYISLKEINNIIYMKDRMKYFLEGIDNLNSRIEDSIRQFNMKQEQIDRQHNKLKNIHL